MVRSEGTDEHDCWVEVVAIDENGSKFRQQEGFAVDERTSFTLPFRGTGSLPQSITLYMYTMWEGMDDPQLSTLDGITLQILK